MKSIKIGMIIGAILAVILSPITVHAESAQERWLRKQRESNEEFMKECEKDGNLTETAEKALSWNKTKKKTSNKTETKNNSNTSTTDIPRGYVYGVDELHVTGLPTDEKGYTKAGDYGKIEK